MYKVGDSLLGVELADQHEVPYRISRGSKTILFVAKMDASKIIHNYFEPRKTAYMEKHSVFVISDISRMPSLITRFVALPKMRSYSYRLLLIRKEGAGSRFPRQNGKVTIIRLNKGIITSVSFHSKPDEIEKQIETAE